MTIILGLLRNQVGDFRWTSETLRSTRHSMLFQKFPERFHSTQNYSRISSDITINENLSILIEKHSFYFLLAYTFSEDILITRSTSTVPSQQDFTRILEHSHSENHSFLPWVWASRLIVTIIEIIKNKFCLERDLEVKDFFSQRFFCFPTNFNILTFVCTKKIMSSGMGYAILTCGNNSYIFYNKELKFHPERVCVNQNVTKVYARSPQSVIDLRARFLVFWKLLLLC